MNTLLLTLDNWDLCLDASGNIAMATEPYALAQDVASAIKTFLGDCWYDDTIGIPYLTEILGETPPATVFQEYMVAAALTVPGVVKAKCVISAFEGRTVTGQITFVDTNNVTTVVNF